MSVAKQLINESLSTATFCVNAYLQDLSDEDLLRRPCDGGNHIAWQLGHLLASDNRLINSVCPTLQGKRRGRRRQFFFDQTEVPGIDGDPASGFARRIVYNDRRGSATRESGRDS